MAAIEQYNFAQSGLKKCIRLKNEDLVRLLPARLAGSNWNKLRVMALCSFTTDISGSPWFYIGFCSGTAQPFGHASCTNWLGFGWGNSWSKTTYGARNLVYYSLYPGAVGKRVAGVSTITNPGNYYSAMTRLPEGHKGWMGVDITRGSPNFGVNAWMRDATPDDDAYSGIKDIGDGYQPVFAKTYDWNALVYTETAVTYTGNYNVATSEAAGEFNAVNLTWTGTPGAVEIYAVLAARLY